LQIISKYLFYYCITTITGLYSETKSLSIHSNPNSDDLLKHGVHRIAIINIKVIGK
jgi:hypothetical protein